MDLLFVSDTSGSLNEERGKIAAAIGELIDRLPPGVDYRIAVMPGHGSLSPWSGRLYGKNKNFRVLGSDRWKFGKIRKELLHVLQRLPGDSASDGGEELMVSFLRGLEEDRLGESRALGFFRENAALSVIFVSDENDICFPPELYGMGTFPDYAYDHDQIEPVAFARDCRDANGNNRVTPSAVIEKVRAFQAGRPFLLSGLVYTDGRTIPRHGENSIGHGILELVRMAGGALVDLAIRDFGVGLARMGELTANKMTLLTEFQLDGTDIDPSSIEVSVDGVRVPYKFHAETATVEIQAANAGKCGSEIVIRYCRKSNGGIGGGVGV